MTIRRYIGISIAATILLTALAAYGLWYSAVSRKAAEAAQLGSELRTLGEAGGRAASVRRAKEELDRQEALVYGHFVDNATIVPFLETIESTGRSLGAEIDVVSVGDAQGKSNQLQMALSITGSFDAVVRTLGAIEYQAYDTTLTSFTLDTPPTDDAVWTAAATFLVGKRPAVATTTPTRP